MNARGLLAGVGLLGLVAGEAWRSRRLVEQLHVAQEQVQHDDLTGLLNRAGIGQRVTAAIAEHGQAALLMVDLDRFKEVNDTYGHLAGNAVLAEVARRIEAVLASGEVAARHGGDEYSVLTESKPGPWMRSRRAALSAAVCGPMTLPNGTEIDVQASVGQAVAATERELWEAVCKAMYQDKAARRAARDLEVAA